jgi:hypothetical protein
VEIPRDQLVGAIQFGVHVGPRAVFAGRVSRTSIIQGV